MFFNKLKFLFLVQSFFLILVSSVFTYAEEKTSAKVLGETIFFVEDSDEYHDNGKLARCMPKKPMTIQGFPCDRDEIRFHDNGKLADFFLSKDFTIQGYPCQKGYVDFDKNGKLKYFTLSKPITIQGYPCDKSLVCFFDNGKLYYCSLVKPITIQGYPCDKSLVIFFDNGKLNSCKLTKPMIIQGYPCEEFVISFHENGKLASFTLSKDFIIHDVKYSKGTKITFDLNGKIRIKDNNEIDDNIEDEIPLDKELKEDLENDEELNELLRELEEDLENDEELKELVKELEEEPVEEIDIDDIPLDEDLEEELVEEIDLEDIPLDDEERELSDKAIAEFDETVYDFGEILEGEIVKHSYKIKNIGSNTLKIYDVRASCGCTALRDFPKELKPGEEGYIKIEYNSTNRAGETHKSIIVKTNSQKLPNHRLEIGGKVNAFIKVEPRFISYGRIELDERRIARIRLTMNPDLGEDFEIEKIISDKKYIETEIITIEKSKKYEIKVSLDIELALKFAKEEREKRLASIPEEKRDETYANLLNFYGNIRIFTTNEKKREIRINFNGTIAE